MRQPLRLASRPPPAALLGELPRRAQISGGQAADSRCGARREGHSSSLSTADSRCERATRGTTEFVVALRGVRRRAPAAAWRPPPPGARRRLAPAAAWRPPLAAPRPPPWRRRPAPAAAWRPPLAAPRPPPWRRRLAPPLAAPRPPPPGARCLAARAPRRLAPAAPPALRAAGGRPPHGRHPCRPPTWAVAGRPLGATALRGQCARSRAAAMRSGRSCPVQSSTRRDASKSARSAPQAGRVLRPVHAAPARRRGCAPLDQSAAAGSRSSASGGPTGAHPRPSGSLAPVRLSATGPLTDPADERGQAEARGSASLVPLPPAAPG